MKNKTLGFIGGGRITRIILQAFRNKNMDFDLISIYDPDKEVTDNLKKQFKGINIAGTSSGPAAQDIIFLAVHPPVIMDTIKEISKVVRENSIVVSLAPKITVDQIISVIPQGQIIRMIPNATSYINKGYNPVCFHKAFSPKEKKELMKLFRKMGKTIEVIEEELEAYAIVSAMLPTYFWFQWKKMEEIAIRTGLTKDASRRISKATLSRAIKLYYNSGLSPEEVIDLIPVKPIGEHEKEIETILENKLLGLYQKIKP
jgi:pyrroline-5-carboxylate reductase